MSVNSYDNKRRLLWASTYLVNPLSDVYCFWITCLEVSDVEEWEYFHAGRHHKGQKFKGC